MTYSSYHICLPGLVTLRQRRLGEIGQDDLAFYAEGDDHFGECGKPPAADGPCPPCQVDRDELTALPAFSCFEKCFVLVAEQAAMQFRPLSMARIDIDGFAAFNRNHGWQTGDSCLRLVAGVLQQRLFRQCDLLVRRGEDEFWVLMPDTDADGAMQVAERLMRGIRQLRIDLDTAYVGITASIGLNTIRPSEARFDTELLFDLAGHALHLAKLDGRNRIAEACPGRQNRPMLAPQA